MAVYFAVQRKTSVHWNGKLNWELNNHSRLGLGNINDTYRYRDMKLVIISHFV